MKYIGNIRTISGNWFKVFWDKYSLRVAFKNKIDGNFQRAPSALNEKDAIKSATNEAEKIN